MRSSETKTRDLVGSEVVSPLTLVQSARTGPKVLAVDVCVDGTPAVHTVSVHHSDIRAACINATRTMSGFVVVPLTWKVDRIPLCRHNARALNKLLHRSLTRSNQCEDASSFTRERKSLCAMDEIAVIHVAAAAATSHAGLLAQHCVPLFRFANAPRSSVPNCLHQQT